MKLRGIGLRVVAGATLLVSSLLVTGKVIQAATPASATIASGGTVSWDFAPVVAGTVLNTGVQDVCPPGPCDNFDLAVSLPGNAAPSTYYQSNIGTLTITYTWNSTVPTDLDIFAISPNAADHGPGSPDNTSTGAGIEVLTITNPLPGTWHVRSVASLAPVPTGAHAVATLNFSPRTPPPSPTPNPADPTFLNYHAPSPILQRSGEPSLGANWSTPGVVMYEGAGCITCNPTTARVNFNDSVTPATATWTDVSPPLENKVTTDPIGLMDHTSVANRWFTSQLAGACSITSFTNDNGAHWTPSEGCGPPAGVDHQTLGSGPFAAPAPATATWPHAVYYCSQDLVTAWCERSDNGGLTFGPPISIYNLTTCPSGLHGHVKVGPDGTVYVPNRACLDSAGVSRPGLAISRDNGLTWHVVTIPDGTSPGQGSDPSVTVSADNTVYFAYEAGNGHPMVAVSHDHGATWGKSVDVGTPFGTQNIEFPAIVAGDANRAAVSYIGTDMPGDSQSSDFPGVWHLYIAFTYDGGKTYTTVDATPHDPVQRGCVWLGGGSNQCRNMLDFNDTQIDQTGRVLVAYTDGCTGACVTDPNAAPATSGGEGKYSRIAAIARQASGKGLFAAYDNTYQGGANSDDVCFATDQGLNSDSQCDVNNQY